MADPLYLNLWFPSFAAEEMLPRLLSVVKEFPASANQPGVGYAGIHPISWNEPTVLEETFDFRTDPEVAIEMFREYVHADYAFELQAAWDIWAPVAEGDLDPKWVMQPQTVSFIAHGMEFDDGAYQEQGHLQINFGLDTAFLHEELQYSQEIERHIKANVRKLVTYTQALEKNCGITGRLLWSESGENLAQKLISRLQRVQ